MGNGFEALKGMAAELKAQARVRTEEKEEKERAQQRIARETKEFLTAMHKTGVKEAGGGIRLSSSVTDDKIDFGKAMTSAGVVPLGAEPRVRHKKVVKPEPKQTIADQAAVLEESLSDENDSIEFLESEDGKSYRRPEVGPDVPRDLRRGRWTVVGQIDLHGMFVDEARDAVIAFLKNAVATERFCVRIVHGKGNGSPDRQSILREKVRRWLKQRQEVVAFCEAREYDGGAGATIVRLRTVKPAPVQAVQATPADSTEIK